MSLNGALLALLLGGQVAASSADPNKKICKRQNPIGSNIPTKVCRTRAEWNERASEARRASEAIDRQRIAPGEPR